MQFWRRTRVPAELLRNFRRRTKLNKHVHAVVADKIRPKVQFLVDVAETAVQDRRAPHPTCPILILQLAESHLTPTLFRQILGRIERLAWHPDVIERTAWLGERRVTRAGVSLKWRGSDGTPVDQARSVVSAPRQHRCDVLGTDRTSSLDVMCFRSAA